VVGAVITARLLAVGVVPVSVGVAEEAVEVAKDSLDTGEADVISTIEVITDADVELAKVNVSMVAEEEEAEEEGVFVVV
jgi:hypothetical protein